LDTADNSGSSIKFLDVVSVISKFAFLVTPYPLILSMEIHCGLDQQLKMAKIFREILADDLLLHPIDPSETKLPSPEELKYKILLKVLIPAARSFLTEIKNACEESEDSISDISLSVTESGSDSDTPIVSSGLPRRQSFGQTHPKTSKIGPTLCDMAVYTKAFKWRSFKHPESKLFNHIFSFSEIKFKELIKTAQTNHSLEKHNLRHLMRVYPGITRVSSNNFDPIMFWTKGVQMVALNWQTYGIVSSVCVCSKS
jgi:phosphatidylinositol phospholipase C delta